MGSYRDDKKLASVDPFTWSYQSTKLGFGLLATGLALLVMGYLIFAAVSALIGATLVWFGLRGV